MINILTGTQVMVLQEVQHYLSDRPTISLAEIAQHFQVDVDVMRSMLDRLMRKGRVRKLETKKCSGCHTCNPASLELYEWVRPHH